MSKDRLLDCRPARRDTSLAAASAHPELLCGYLAERPHIAANICEQPPSSIWSYRMLAATAVAVVAVLLLPAFKDYDSSARAQAPLQAAACAPWETAAGDAVAQLVQGSKMDLAQVSDAVARLRRARRSCELGWIDFACRDYQTIVAAAPRTLGGATASSWACPSERTIVTGAVE
jgi:hypothetical protein